jgi:hypothetical protein
MPGAARAVPFVVDGLRPEEVPLAPTPHIDALIARGASSMAIALTSGHGTEMPEDTMVPWILTGASAVEGRRLPSSMNIVDIAPSLLYQLDIERLAEWLGNIARQAFVAPNTKALGPPVSRAGTEVR